VGHNGLFDFSEDANGEHTAATVKKMGTNPDAMVECRCVRRSRGNVLAAREILGHSTTKITEQHYIAAIPEAGRKGMTLLEARLKELSK
jgi:hypothetical protein